MRREIVGGGIWLGVATAFGLFMLAWDSERIPLLIPPLVVVLLMSKPSRST